MKKKIIVSIMTIIILLGICGVTKAASTSISATNTSPTVGANVTITVRFSQPVTTADFRFNYDSSKLQYVSNSLGGTNMGSYVKVDYIDLDLKTISSASFTFKAKTAGTANCSISNIVASDANANVLNTSASSININVKNKSNTNNNNNNNTNSSSSNNNNSSNTKPTFTSVNQKVYAKETVSIRDSWSTKGELLGTLQKDSSITRTGIGSNGWDRVTYNGRTAYISHTYLTTTKPKDDKDDKKDDDKNNTTNEENNTQANEIENNTTNNEINNNETNDINNNETNEATNTQTQGKKDDKKGFNVNTIEMIIIGVIILAIIVIIVNEIVAKKRREARRKEEKRVKGSRR